MPGLRNQTIMRDIPLEESAATPLAAWVDSLEDKPGNVNPADPRHAPVVEQMYNAIVQGQLDDARVQKLAKNNPMAAPVFLNALTIQKANKQKFANTSQYFHPGRPEQNVVTGGEDDQMVRFQPAVAPKADIQGAVLDALHRGDVDYANKIRLAVGAEGKGPGLYGGIQYAYDENTKQYVPYSFDEVTRKPVSLGAPEGLRATIPMMPQVVQGANGPVVVQVPGRGTPGITPTVTDTTLRPPAKDLSPEAIKDIAEVTATAEQSRNLLGGFKNEFGGFRSSIVGDAVTAWRQRFGDDSGMGDWWNQYQAKKNVTRNKLFGGALTTTEADEWEKADINPGMDPKQIRKNLARRAALEQRAAAKLVRAYQSGNYNKAQIQAVSDGLPSETTKPQSGLTDTQRQRLEELRKKYGR